MTSAEIRRQAIEAAAKAIAKITPREGYEDVPLSEIFPTPRARYRFLHEHYIAAADAAIDAFEAAMWRPISEAPGDRTPVLVWDGREVSEDFCATTIDRWVGRQEGWGPGVTHFHPLPAPPQDPETKP